jgi:hypothetical protein
MASREAEERTGVLRTNDFILACASFIDEILAAYFPFVI